MILNRSIWFNRDMDNKLNSVLDEVNTNRTKPITKNKVINDCMSYLMMDKEYFKNLLKSMNN